MGYDSLKRAVRVAVVMPVGPDEDVEDTLESIRAFIDPSRAIVLVDDTGAKELGARAEARPDVHVLPAPLGAEGNRGGLWIKIAAGYSYACARFQFDLILRMDTDALILGPGIEDAAQFRFRQDPGIGLLGSFRIGPDGGARGFAPAAAILRREAGPLGLRHPALRSRLRRLIREAEQHGYAPGEHALGGAFIHSSKAVRALASRGFLGLPEMAGSGLGEDHIFALLTMAAGYGIGDFGRPGDPLALRWRGLPDDPEALLAGSALVTHSVRSFGDLDEPEIRARFAAARRSRGAPPEDGEPAGSPLGGGGPM